MNTLTRTIQKNITQLQAEIVEICTACGRDPHEIQILAVTKGRSIEEIEAVTTTGLHLIGENKIQEAERKFPILQQAMESGENPSLEKHFIGHLQSNKLNKALELFDVIHAVDTITLAQKINTRAGELNRKVNVFLEANTSEEEQKYGFAMEDLEHAFEEIHFMEHVDVAGFMTLASHSGNEDDIRHCFNMLHDLRDYIQNKHFLETDLKLSMGMSGDFRIAIEEGTDILRIGSRLFM